MNLLDDKIISCSKIVNKKVELKQFRKYERDRKHLILALVTETVSVILSISLGS